MSQPALPLMRVVAGLFEDARGRVLWAQRAEGKSGAGLWELPGGKIEPGESEFEALVRESREELGVRVGAAVPICRTRHVRDSDRLEITLFRVLGYSGLVEAREHSALRWCRGTDALALPMSASDRQFLRWLGLGSRIAITPDWPSEVDVDAQMADCRAKGVQLVIWRCREPERRIEFGRSVVDAAHRHQMRVCATASLQVAQAINADGLHLNRARLRKDPALSALPTGWLLGASCHDAAELKAAEALAVDYALLSPVLPTASHPDAEPLGWPRFQQLAATVDSPVFALGGMTSGELGAAQAHGAMGVAGISGWFGVV